MGSLRNDGECLLRDHLLAALPVTVQLQNADGACWTATYSTAQVNDGTTFRAVAE